MTPRLLHSTIPTAQQQVALLPTGSNEIIASGPGAHIFRALSKGGTYLERCANSLARAQGWGPHNATGRIVSFLGDPKGLECLGKLDKLWRKPEVIAAVSEATASVSEDITATVSTPPNLKELKKLCKGLIKYTLGCVTSLLVFASSVVY